MKYRRLRSSGFTALELIVVTFVCGLIAGAGYFLLHPVSKQMEQNNAERWLGLASMMQDLNHYVAENGDLPADLPTKPTYIGTTKGMYNLCPALVPTFTVDLPLDPKYGFHTVESYCDTTGQNYFSAYQISVDAHNTVTISAPHAEDGAKIQLSHHYQVR